MSDFGLFAKDVNCFVTRNSRAVGKVLSVPVSIGFKQRDGKYANEFFDLVVFEGLQSEVQGLEKGCRLKVSGRVTMETWTDREGGEKKTWKVLVDSLEVVNRSSAPSATEDVPF